MKPYSDDFLDRRVSKPRMPGWLEDHPHVGRTIELLQDAQFPMFIIPKGDRFDVVEVTPGLESGNGYFVEHSEHGRICISAKVPGDEPGSSNYVKQIKLVPILEELARAAEG